MNFLHYSFQLSAEDVVEVTLNRRANVRLLDDANFLKYKRKLRHTYYGGSANQSIVHLAPTHAGHWHVVIDLGGYSGQVKASVSVIKAEHA